MCAGEEVQTDRVLTTGPGDVYIDTNNYWALVTALNVATHLTRYAGINKLPYMCCCATNIPYCTVCTAQI